MARKSILGVITGKLGNMVGQANTLVKGADKQVWRVYRGDVSNPKTIKQAQQRALFVAVKNFQQAFTGILDHSWQGVDYGTKSLNHFRKQVLANGGVNYPGFIIQPKGSQDAIPQPFPISSGSIPFDSSLVWTEFGTVGVVGFNYAKIVATTEGEYWTQFLKANPSFKDGDMITVLEFVCDGAVPEAYANIYPVFDRFIINTASTVAISSSVVISQKGLFSLTTDSIDFNDYIAVTSGNYNDSIIAGAGIIISRQKGTKAQWLRSQSAMYVDSEYRKYLMTQEYVNATLESYMTSSASAESDWYLNETGENTSEGGETGAVLVKSRNMPLSNGNTLSLAYFSKGNRNGYVYRGPANARTFYTLNGMQLIETSLPDGVTAGTTDLINIDLVSTELERASYWVRNIEDIPTDSQPE